MIALALLLLAAEPPATEPAPPVEAAPQLLTLAAERLERTWEQRS